MVVGLLGGFKEEDNFLDLGVFLVGLKRRDVRLGEVGSKTKGQGCNDVKRQKEVSRPAQTLGMWS